MSYDPAMMNEAQRVRLRDALRAYVERWDDAYDVVRSGWYPCDQGEIFCGDCVIEDGESAEALASMADPMGRAEDFDALVTLAEDAPEGLMLVTGETDSPDHCGACDALLDVGLTLDGQDYVAGKLAELVRYALAVATWDALHAGMDTLPGLDAYRAERPSRPRGSLAVLALWYRAFPYALDALDAENDAEALREGIHAMIDAWTRTEHADDDAYSAALVAYHEQSEDALVAV